MWKLLKLFKKNVPRWTVEWIDRWMGVKANLKIANSNKRVTIKNPRGFQMSGHY
jgi:hypothetical protein